MNASRSFNDTMGSPPRRAVSPIPDIVGLGGALAGLAGGLAMAVVAAIISLLLGGDIWLESKQIAAMVLGPAAAQAPGFAPGPVIVGSLIHIVLSAGLGAVYSILKRRIFKLPSDFGVPVLAGLVYGMVLWMVAYYIILPAMDAPLLQAYAPAFIIQHIVYGVVTGLVYTWLRPDPYHE